MLELKVPIKKQDVFCLVRSKRTVAVDTRKIEKDG